MFAAVDNGVALHALTFAEFTTWAYHTLRSRLDERGRTELDEYLTGPERARPTDTEAARRAETIERLQELEARGDTVPPEVWAAVRE